MVVSWATWTTISVHGQSTRQTESVFAVASPVVFEGTISPDAAFGLFRRPAWLDASAAGGGQTKTKTKPQQSPEPVERPPIDPSMVGYIDDALIHSEIRVRFDAGVHDPTPDRAEFFYAKCGCYRGAPVPLFDPKAPGPGTVIPDYVNFQQLNIYGEYAPGHHRYSVFGQLPIRWLQSKGTPNFGSGSGLSDIEVGAKFAPVLSETNVLTFQFASHLPSGDARQGLGTHHATIEPMLLFYHDLAGRGSIEAQFGDTHPLGSSTGLPGVSGGFAGDVMTYGVGGSYQLVQKSGARIAGVLEMVGWHVFGGDVTVPPLNPGSSDGANIVNLKMGPRVSFGEHQSVYFGYGIALTHSEWYHEIFRTEYRYAF
jgi:hypothetical protein